MKYRVSVVGLIKGDSSFVQNEDLKKLRERQEPRGKSYYANQNVFSNRKPTMANTDRKDISIYIEEI